MSRKHEARIWWEFWWQMRCAAKDLGYKDNEATALMEYNRAVDTYYCISG